MLSAFLPADRYRSLLTGEQPGARTVGAALFADISGFTPLTETLTRLLGPRRGAEELTRQLNRVYDALLTSVEYWDGDVISFSGDGVTCWFDAHKQAPPGSSALTASERAVAAGLAMIRTMDDLGPLLLSDGSITTMAVKVAVATGAARRFLVGDPDIQLFDVLAGAVVTHMATGAELVQRGELLVDKSTTTTIGTRLQIAEWRLDPAGGAPFALISALDDPLPAPHSARQGHDHEGAPSATPDILRSWLLPPIFDRLSRNESELLTELRPATALFLRFGGIDYDNDDNAHEQLDRYMRAVQHILAHYNSFLLQLTIGDKGNYLYAAFGAPLAHEDDTQRAVQAALDLQRCPAAPGDGRVQIGLCQGLMRTGAYGSARRRIYGVMGGAANLAARLMTSAPPGGVLASAEIAKEVGATFTWEELPPLQVKGKAEPVAVTALVNRRTPRSLHWPEPTQIVPLVGRRAELQEVLERLQQVRAGAGRLLAIVGAAGLGKSRLLAEVITLASAAGFVCFSGECQSYGTNSAYLVWQPIWRAFFGLHPDTPTAEQIGQVQAALARIDPSLLPRLPLLASVLDLPIPENELTAGLDQHLRKSSCEALLVDCLKARVRRTDAQDAGQQLLFVLEDTHWLDPLSHDLLEALSQAIIGLPVLIVLAYRPPELARLQRPRVMVLPHASTITLGELSPLDSEELIRHKLRQHGLIGVDKVNLPPALVERLASHGEGNPFYIEELLNFLLAQGLDLDNPATWAGVSLPTSLHSLILSRLDQLGERQRTMLRVASIIGRIFRVTWLCGYYPSVGTQDGVTSEMEELCQLELTLRESRELTSSYLFKHVITQVVTYESLAYATRRKLHEQFAHFLEREAEANPPLDLLAYHYARSDNASKQREYLRQAGDAAEVSYANEAALEYYEQLLPLLEAPEEQIPILLQLVTVLERVGRWEEARARAEKAYELAQGLADHIFGARCILALGIVATAQGKHAEAQIWLDRAIQSDDCEVQITALQNLGLVAIEQAAFGSAMNYLREALRLNASRGDGLQSSRILSRLSWVAFMQGEFAEMRDMASAALKEAQWVGSLSAQAEALRRLGMAELSRLAFEPAAEATAAALELYRKMGDREGIASTLHNMGQIYRVQQDYSQAIRYCDEGLTLFRELGTWRHLAMCLYTRGIISYAKGDHMDAMGLLDEGLEVAQNTGMRWVIAACHQSLAHVAIATGREEAARRHCRLALEETTALGVQSVALWTLTGYARLWLDEGRAREAAELIGLVMAHPAGGSDAPLLARQVLTLLEDVLAPEALAAALDAGRSGELNTVVAAILETAA